MILNQTQFGVKDNTMTTSVPNNSIAHLMYYLDSVCCIVPLDQGGFTRLRRYTHYMSLTQNEIQSLIQITALVNPKVLLNNCLFVAPQLCGNFSNKFYKFSKVESILAASNSIVIGGQIKEVTQIMVCKQFWLQKYFYTPFRTILEAIEEEEQARQLQPSININYNYASYPRIGNKKTDSCCSIM